LARDCTELGRDTFLQGTTCLLGKVVIAASRVSYEVDEELDLPTWTTPLLIRFYRTFFF
jgi:hypothetical protein